MKIKDRGQQICSCHEHETKEKFDYNLKVIE